MAAGQFDSTDPLQDLSIRADRRLMKVACAFKEHGYCNVKFTVAVAPVSTVVVLLCVV